MSGMILYCMPGLEESGSAAYSLMNQRHSTFHAYLLLSSEKWL